VGSNSYTGILRMTACYEEIRKEKKKYLSRQNSVLDIFKSSSGPRASPPGLFYIGDDDPDDAPTVQQKVLPP
jgi:hypothetical protein